MDFSVLLIDMRQTLTMLFSAMLWIGSATGQANSQSSSIGDYWVAKYSMQIDYSHLQFMSPDYPVSIKSYNYYIHYGDNIVIELSDPGNETDILPVVIRKWDYQSGTWTWQTLYKNVRKYYVSYKAIPFSIEESRNTVKNLCESSSLNPRCDSVLLISEFDAQYVVELSEDLVNIRSYKLFYPDLSRLPKSIRRQDIYRNPSILEQVLYGKEVVDSLLTNFSHEGYDRITDEEMNSYELVIPLEELEGLEQMRMTNDSIPQQKD